MSLESGGQGERMTVPYVSGATSWSATAHSAGWAHSWQGTPSQTTEPGEVWTDLAKAFKLEVPSIRVVQLCWLHGRNVLPGQAAGRVSLCSGMPVLTSLFASPPALKVGLRQLDMSLLCQLYSLYESIQEYKGACQVASSPDCMYVPENRFFVEEEEGFQDQSPSREGRDGGPPGNLPLSVPRLSSSNWILESI